MRVVATPDNLLQEVDGATTLLNAVTERYYRMDPLASSLWRQLVGQGEAVETVVERMAAEHSVTADIVRRDVLNFIEQLRAAGFVQVVPDTAASGSH